MRFDEQRPLGSMSTDTSGLAGGVRLFPAMVADVRALGDADYGGHV